MPIAMIEPSCQKQIPAPFSARIGLTLTSRETIEVAVRRAPFKGA
jgi:hypothetical protein